MTHKSLVRRDSGTSTDEGKLYDTWDIVVVHRFFRRQFALLPQLVAGVEHGARVRSAEVARHLVEMVHVLHHHHRAEDELLWPLLTQRAALPAEQLRRMEALLERLDDLLVSVETAADEWGGVGDRLIRHELVGLLELLSESVIEQLDEEETHMLPVVERCLTAQEWALLGQRSLGGLPRSRLLVLLGYLLEHASETERARLLRRLPLSERVAYRVVGQRRYRSESSRLRDASVA